MKFCEKKRVANSDASEYASAEDFQQLFVDNVDELYHISFLLTGDHEKAMQCFVAGCDDSVNVSWVLKEWAHTWAKRAIIENAIRAMKPRPQQQERPTSSRRPAAQASNQPINENCGSVLDRVMALDDFSRFVFVITALAGHSERVCALLLRVSLRDVRDARILANEQIFLCEYAAQGIVGGAPC